MVAVEGRLVAVEGRLVAVEDRLSWEGRLVAVAGRLSWEGKLVSVEDKAGGKAEYSKAGVALVAKTFELLQTQRSSER